MRRIARLDRSIGHIQYRASKLLLSSYLCPSCGAHTNSFSTSQVPTARTTTYTDRIRQRIWGTDNPPGLADPYGDSSVIDKSLQKWRKTEDVGEKEKEVSAITSTKSSESTTAYVPAETWDGLEQVGGEEFWEPEHPFRSFVPSEVTTEDEVITVAFHRALVEVFATRQAGKPLSIVSEAEPGDYLTEDVQLEPSATGVTLRFPGTITLDQIVQSLSPDIDETKEKLAPTESEEDVAADRSTVDPLLPGTKSEITDETVTKEAPTESEEDVAADRSTIDPLTDSAPSLRTYSDVIAAWDPSWLQISLQDTEVKFAVSPRL